MASESSAPASAASTGSMTAVSSAVGSSAASFSAALASRASTSGATSSAGALSSAAASSVAAFSATADSAFSGLGSRGSMAGIWPVTARRTLASAPVGATAGKKSMMDTRAGFTVGVGRVSASRRASSATAYQPGWTAGSSASSSGARDAAISAGVGAGGGTSAGAIAWTVSVMTGRPVRTGGGTCTGCFTDVSRAGIGVVSCSSGDSSTSDEA